MRWDKSIKVFLILTILFLFSFGIAIDMAVAADRGGNSDSLDSSDAADSANSPDATNSNEEDVTETDVEVDSLKKHYDWLANNSVENPGSVLEQGLAIAALADGRYNIKKNVEILIVQQDKERACFPADNCRVTETAGGLLGLYVGGQDTSKVKKYLLDGGALAPGLRAGEWRLQLDVEGSGTCAVKYGKSNKSKTFTIANGTIKNSKYKYYIDISTELDSSLIGNKVSQPIQIDCKDLIGVTSLVYYLKSSNSYFLLESQSLDAGIANLKIVNACFRSTAGSGGCDLESTLYGTWALVESGEQLGDIGTLPYLESIIIISSTNILQKAILVRILQKAGNDNEFFDNMIVSSQKNGNWAAGDIYTTSWAVFSLQKGAGTYGDVVGSGMQFIERRAEPQGGWGNLKNSAMALIALSENEITRASVSGVGGKVAGGEPDASLDDICQGNAEDKFGKTGCNSPSCRTYKKGDIDCYCKNGIIDEGEDDVDCGGDCEPCDTTGMTKDSDSDLGFDDETDMGSTGDRTTPPKKVEEGLSGFTWFLIILAILAVIGVGAFYYFKSKGIDITQIFKKKEKKPSFEEFKVQQTNKPMQLQTRTATAKQPIKMPAGKPIVRKTGGDEELERSLREAEKLLKGK